MEDFSGIELYNGEGILGVDAIFTKEVLERLIFRLSQQRLQTRLVAIPIGLVKCMFRRAFSKYFSGRVPQKILSMIHERITANKRIGNWGRNTSDIGGIYKKSLQHCRAIAPVNFGDLQIVSTFFLLEHRIPPPMNVDQIFIRAFDPSRPILFDHLPVFIHLLRRLCYDIRVNLQIQTNRQLYTDDCCDCPSSYCLDDSSFEIDMGDCYDLLAQISTSLENFASQFRKYPYSRLLNSI
jgi:hypothetical protein